MSYLITFYTNFDASVFMHTAKKFGTARMKPVPRQLSSSCGTCILFTPTAENQLPPEILHLSFEKFYQVTDAGYELLKEQE